MDNRAPRLIVVVILIAAASWTQWQEVRSSIRDKTSSEPGTESSTPSTGIIEELFRLQQSDTVVEVLGQIRKILPDDNVGSKHQKFILALQSGHTVLISHNISLAPRVPARENDTVRVRGEYEWNAQGGVIHWTHHDPQGKRPGGWIRHAGQEYR